MWQQGNNWNEFWKELQLVYSQENWIWSKIVIIMGYASTKDAPDYFVNTLRSYEEHESWIVPLLYRKTTAILWDKQNA